MRHTRSDDVDSILRRARPREISATSILQTIGGSRRRGGDSVTEIGAEAAYRFRGRERVTIEIEGAFERAALAVPAGVSLDPPEGPGRVRLFAFFVEGIRIRGVPLLRASYAEVLWRVAVRADGEPAWWAICCDLGARAPRLAARRWVRYPVRQAAVEVTEERVRVTAGAGELSIAIGRVGEPAAASEPRRLLTGMDAVWVVPWGDGSTASCHVGFRATNRASRRANPWHSQLLLNVRSRVPSRPSGSAIASRSFARPMDTSGSR